MDVICSQKGSASGFLATGRVVGQSLSVALAGAIFAGLGGAAAGRILATQQYAHNALSAAQVSILQQTFSHGFQAAFITCAVIAAIGIFASLVRGKEQRT